MRRSMMFALVLALAPLASGCDDGTFQIDPVLVQDTVTIAAPGVAQNAGLPSALDATAFGDRVGGGRFPERAADADNWDFTVRIRNGQVVLVPAGALGLPTRPALTPPLPQTFEGLVEAPGRATFRTDTAFVMQVGNVHAAVTRETIGGIFGGICVQYAKLQPLEVDPALGRVRLRITTNERCQDPRLAEEG